MADAPSNFEATRSEKLQRIAELGLDPWGQRFDGRMGIGDIRQLDPAQQPPAKVRAAGRILQRRKQGKLYFLDIWDWTGKIQVMVGQKQVGETGWALAENLDLGDLLAVEGSFQKTRMGELTIFADGLHFMAKSMLPHPDKWAGMQEMEYRLRHRYLDLIYTPETLDRALKRIKIIRTIRTYLEKEGFVEVETPTLHAIAGGAAARPFVTHHNALDIDMYLRIALELHLKRLLVGGIERVYEIGRVFRNEGIDARHNPEFTMIELYQAYGDYRSMMDVTEGVVVACVDMLGGGRQLPYGDKVVDYSPPWQRLAYGEAFQTHVGVPMDDRAAVRAAAVQFGIKFHGEQPAGAAAPVEKDHDVLVHELFEAKVEDKLAGPVFIYDYPAGLCPLTKRKKDNPSLAERFEIYIQFTELGNAYTELNDPVLQEATFRQQLAGQPDEDSMAKMDEDFVRALRYGMPPAGGLGIGIDRLVMLLTNTQTIRDVILFPLLRPSISP